MPTKLSINELRQIVKQTLKEYKDDRGAISIQPDIKSQSRFSNEEPHKQYQALASEYYMMKNLVAPLNENENGGESLIQMIEKDEWEQQDGKLFKTSLYASKRKQFLSPYTEEEFNAMRLFKLKNYKVGYAIKSDGDIIGVHNNEGISGLGEALMKSAIKNGGTKLDHFDGYLTGLYSRTGFNKVVHIDEWNEEYAPNGWEYEKVNIFSPRFSAYANKPEIRKLADNPKAIAAIAKNYEVPIPLVNAVRNYETGRPSIIYRILS